MPDEKPDQTSAQDCEAALHNQEYGAYCAALVEHAQVLGRLYVTDHLKKPQTSKVANRQLALVAGVDLLDAAAHILRRQMRG